MLYYLVKFIQILLLKLPLYISFHIGRILGLLFYLNAKFRKTAFWNIKSAFPAKSAAELHRILRKSFENLGLSIIELLIAPKIYKYIELEEAVTRYPKGGIFVGIHAGSWEAAISYWANRHDFAILAQPQKHKGLDRFLNELREKEKIRVCLSTKELIKCLRGDYMVGVVIDHGAEEDALYVNFFSHLVPTPKGGVYLAKKFNKYIYTTFCYRKKGFSHVLVMGPPIDPSGKDDKDILQKLNNVYESYLTKHPWEYFWYYKRFKYKRDREVVILSDKKIGHVKQSKAFLSFFSEKAKERNCKVKNRVIEVSYKNAFCKVIADVLAFFAGKGDIWCGRALSMLLDRKTWNDLNTIYADVVISTGTHIAPINKLFSSYLNARSAVILRPNIPLSKFDISIIPEHDRVYSKNCTTIKGAIFYPEDLKAKALNCKRFFGLSEAKKISFFIGGPLADKESFLGNLDIFLPKLKKFSLDKGYKILVSTSRRTPKEAEESIERELAGFKNTEAIVIANRDNQDFAFEGFGFLSEIIFVSSESISMVSEVASLKKPCACVFFEPEDIKRRLFLDSIANEVIFLRKPYDFKFSKIVEPSILDNNKKILSEAAARLL